MPLTAPQLAALKADVAANANLIPAGYEWTGAYAGLAINSLPNDQDANTAIAGWYNLATDPAFWVWRSRVSRSDVYNTTSDLSPATHWNWTTYKNQSVTEQNAWTQMFMGDQADFSKPNLRAGIAAIFTGSAQANAQRDHCLAVGRRAATRAEKLLAAGAGTAASPATLPENVNYSFELSEQDVTTARNLE